MTKERFWTVGNISFDHIKLTIDLNSLNVINPSLPGFDSCVCFSSHRNSMSRHQAHDLLGVKGPWDILLCNMTVGNIFYFKTSAVVSLTVYYVRRHFGGDIILTMGAYRHVQYLYHSYCFWCFWASPYKKFLHSRRAL